MFGLFNCRPYSTGFEYEWFYFYFYLSWSWQLLIIKVSRCDTCLCCTHISQAWIVSLLYDRHGNFFLPVIGDRHGRIRRSHLAFGCGNIQATLITIGNSDRSFTSSPTCIFPCLLFFGVLFLHLWWGSEMVLCMERKKENGKSWHGKQFGCFMDLFRFKFSLLLCIIQMNVVIQVYTSLLVKESVS